MAEEFKALAVILILAAAGFLAVRQPACQLAIGHADFARRRNLWLGITLIAFLCHSFWIFVLATGALLLYVASRDTNRAALYFFLMFAIPQISAQVGGLGIVRYILEVDFMRVLALSLLLPAAVILRREEVEAGRQPLSAPDLILLAYLVLNLGLATFTTSMTDVMRNAFYAFIDVILPYYVVGRSLRNLAAFRDAMASFVVAASVMAVIGMFEFAKHWLLYRSLDGALGVTWGYGGYLDRGESLRAMVSTGQPIVMGYVMAAAIGCFLYVRRFITGRLAVASGFALLVAGELVPLSRGPWIGAAAIYVAYLATGPNALSRVGKAIAICLILAPIVYVLPNSEKLIDYIPFLGHIDEGNVTYRERLLALSIDIIIAHPFFGSSDFLLYLEEMRQGQGIIDIVNTYLIVALNSGLVGLSLFAGFFAAIMVGIFRQMRRFPGASELHQLGQALIAILAGILIMIVSVSPINAVPLVYWSVAGLGLAYIRLARATEAA